MEPVQLANPENAFEGGVLDKKWMFNVVGHLNLWHAGEVKLPSTEWGSGRILVSNTGWVVDLTRLKVPASSQLQCLREFDISVQSNPDSTVRVMNGTWIGVYSGAGTNPYTRGWYSTVTVADGDTVYVKLDRLGNTLSYLAAATPPASSPELGWYYANLALITITGGRIGIQQYRWGPLEYLPPFVNYFPLDDSSSSTAHTDYWANYKPYNASGVLRNGYNAVTWTGDRYYQTSASTTIGGNTFYIVTTKVFSRTVTIDSNGGASDISTEFLKKTLTWLSDTSV